MRPWQPAQPARPVAKPLQLGPELSRTCSHRVCRQHRPSRNSRSLVGATAVAMTRTTTRAAGPRPHPTIQRTTRTTPAPQTCPRPGARAPRYQDTGICHHIMEDTAARRGLGDTCSYGHRICVVRATWSGSRQRTEKRWLRSGRRRSGLVAVLVDQLQHLVRGPRACRPARAV